MSLRGRFAWLPFAPLVKLIVRPLRSPFARRKSRAFITGPFKPVKERPILRDQIEANRDSNSEIVPSLCFSFFSMGTNSKATNIAVHTFVFEMKWFLLNEISDEKFANG